MPRKRRKGGNILKKGLEFLKKHKVISGLAGAANRAGILSKYTGPISQAASALGYGRRRRARGGCKF